MPTSLSQRHKGLSDELGPILAADVLRHTTHRSASVSITSSLVMPRSTFRARHSRVYLSTIDNHFNLLPLVVLSKKKPLHHVLFGASARRRWHPLTLDLRRRFFRCFTGTFSPLSLPQTKHSRQLRTPSFFSKHQADAAISVPWLRPRQLQHPLYQRYLIRAGLGLKSLTATRLSHHRTSPSLGDAELRAKLDNRRSLPGRAYQFPSERCLSI
jgi:hypothetical protein